VEKGSDFLGYHFGPQGLTMARATIERLVERTNRLYEQKRQRPKGPSPLGAYVRRCVGWATGGGLAPPSNRDAAMVLHHAVPTIR
jgi:hypothetical protein